MTAVSVHLIDGTYELFRAYFAVPSQKGPAGQEVGAVRGLMASLLALVARPDVTHVACAFDHVIESFRNDLFPDYKSGAGLPEELFSQFELAESATRALGIVTWPMLEFEADDALASAAARFAPDPRVGRVVICSPDKDLLQCVRADRVVTWDRQRDKIYDASGVIEKLGVSAEQVPDFLALVGDTADGIPGIARWGKASAARVLRAVGSLEAIPARVADLPDAPRGAEGLLGTLNAERELAALYKRLATLRLDVPLVESLDDLEYRGPERARFTTFCDEIGADRLFSRVSRFAGE